MHKAKLQIASLVTLLLLAGCTTPMHPEHNTSLVAPTAEDIHDALVVIFNAILEIAYSLAQSNAW